MVKKSAKDINKTKLKSANLSKAFIQIQNGCNHNCAYCIVSKLRGKSISFPYEQILKDVNGAIQSGFQEIVLTGVDIAGYHENGEFLSDLCEKLLNDMPELKRLRLSSMDPASPECAKVIKLMERQPRMLPHMHLSMQSGSDKILFAMGRRHNSEMVKKLMTGAVSFSWDIICGFPGEAPELFTQTCELIKELRPIHIHAFPFSPRPGTLAVTMTSQVHPAESKRRVKIINDLAEENKKQFMKTQVGKTLQLLLEKNNIGRTVDDIPVLVSGEIVPEKTIDDFKIVNINDNYLLA
jgi:threonylcarbamoyladenosine tRNA methylthiotransferase MtaB